MSTDSMSMLGERKNDRPQMSSQFISHWSKPAEKQTVAPAPPPEWTRYIDSRLKQFCSR